ncbi:unnamed protein product [Dovyalis caffra]|uniref:Uncharacterized protein n=1 Tax=Dovyalis caffra TaxID=77055 RepID=A0AAV1SXD4_9ROSI|nr:unnamed protein product [Dovyalis caffra]
MCLDTGASAFARGGLPKRKSSRWEIEFTRLEVTCRALRGAIKPKSGGWVLKNFDREVGSPIEAEEFDSNSVSALSGPQPPPSHEQERGQDYVQLR